MKILRAWLAGIGVLLLSACAAATPVAPTAVADLRSAVVSEFSGVVNGRITAAEALAPVSVGFTLRPSGEVQTGEASRARLDLSDGSLVRLGALTSFVLEDLTLSESNSVFLRLQMAFGKIWVSLTGGELEVETPVGVAAVRGSFAVIQYAPNDPNNPDDDVLVLDCLEGSCRAVSPIINAQLGNLERIVIGSQTTLRQPLTEADVQNFIRENPESARLEATLTAAPPATATPTLPPSATPTLAASETPTPSATPLPPTATGNPALTPTPSVPLIGVHRVQPGETIFCIARAYGVLPEAIIQVNDLRAPITLSLNQPLNIPAVRWVNISSGPVCAAQFRSPFPGLPTATLTASATVTSTPSVTPTATPSLTATLTETPIITATPTLDPKRGFFWSVSNINLNGQGSTIRADAGSSITVFLDFQIWNAADCPRCTAQIVIGLNNQGQYCAYDGIPGVYPGLTSVSQGSLTAPRVPGTYTLTAGYDRQSHCSQARESYTGGTTIGTIIVP